MIGIVDFGSTGNVQSVANAFARAGETAPVIRKFDCTAKLDGLVIPGVGSFSVVPKLVSVLGGAKKASEIRIPVLCICLGMQAMLEKSEEAPGAAGLGIITGRVKRLVGKVRLPQLGWNSVWQNGSDELFDGIEDGSYFYFANTYAAFPSVPECVIGKSRYGSEFVSAVRKGNWWGVQFHPEKSGSAGQKMIENFIGISREWKR